MGNLGGQEILVILLVGLIVLGPSKLPAAIRQAGRFAAETRRVAAGFKREFQDALGDPLAESKAMLKSADPRSLAADAAPSTETDKPPAKAADAAPSAETGKSTAESPAPAQSTETGKSTAESPAPAQSTETDKRPAASESSPDDGPT